MRQRADCVFIAVMDDGDGAYVNVVTSRDEKGYPQVNACQ